MRPSQFQAHRESSGQTHTSKGLNIQGSLTVYKHAPLSRVMRCRHKPPGALCLCSAPCGEHAEAGASAPSAHAGVLSPCSSNNQAQQHVCALCPLPCLALLGPSSAYLPWLIGSCHHCTLSPAWMLTPGGIAGLPFTRGGPLLRGLLLWPDPAGQLGEGTGRQLPQMGCLQCQQACQPAVHSGAVQEVSPLRWL